MMIQYEDDPHSQFGINEVYFHKGLELNLLDKLQQRATFSLDNEDTIAKKTVTQEMILIFHKRVPSKSLIYRYLEFLHQYKNKESYIRSNTLLNEEELFEAIKSKDFVFATHRTLSKKSYSPS